MHLRRRHSIAVFFAAILLVYFLFLSFANQDGEIHHLSGFTMGTTYNLQIVGSPGIVEPEELAAAVTALLNRLDRKIFSTYVTDSELSRFNQAPVNQPFNASAELMAVLQIALQVSELSSGAFDITVGPLVNLWGFGPDLSTPIAVPEQAELDEIMGRIGYQYLQLDPDNLQVTKTRPVVLDLSAVAKGYAVDQVADYFDDLGFESYFLEIGGELKIKGYKPGQQSWVPAIEKPVVGQSQIQEIFYSNGQQLAVAGSGDYRNYFEDNGTRYSHEIDPRSGRPISHHLAAVYVLHEQVAWADALATALMIMGVEQGTQLATELNLAAYFISRNEDAGFDLSYTQQFAKYLQPQ